MNVKKKHLMSSLLTAIKVLILVAPIVFIHGIWPSERAVDCLLCYLVVLAIYSSRLKILSPSLLYSAPWIFILLISRLNISFYSQKLLDQTYIIVASTIIAVSIISIFVEKRNAADLWSGKQEVRTISVRRFNAFFIVFISLAILNIVFSGYVPLINGLVYGDTGYLDFGVPTVYGLFNAYANAFGLLSFYLYIKTNKKEYLFAYFIVILSFVMFVSRQNVLSLIIETFILRIIVVGVPNKGLIVATLISLLALFSIAGELRSGSIRDLLRINAGSDWIPDFFLWIYAYSYFNILNFDNVVYHFQDPLYSGVSFARLLPSFLRPPSDLGMESYLELSNLNVFSYLNLPYIDGGLVFCLFIAAAFSLWAVFILNKIRTSAKVEFVDIATCSVLSFCMLFSFFDNFYFYLPVIGQLIFMPLLNRTWLRPETI